VEHVHSFAGMCYLSIASAKEDLLSPVKDLLHCVHLLFISCVSGLLIVWFDVLSLLILQLPLLVTKTVLSEEVAKICKAHTVYLPYPIFVFSKSTLLEDLIFYHSFHRN